MTKRYPLLRAVLVSATIMALSGAAGAGNANQNAQPEPYGVGVTPAVYLINFMLMYIASPNQAANMPAYRAPIPSDLADCLDQNPLNPEKCTYFEYANTFADAPLRGSVNQTKNCRLPPVCRTAPKWERLAPSVAKHPDQINQPLGLARANEIAEALLIDKSMILTDREYECTMGIPPRTPNRQIIFSCLNNLTNSNGNTNIPLSSYGLALNNDGDVQSLCAPNAPCLVFNDLFGGDLQKIALECGWAKKLDKMYALTPFKNVLMDAEPCQESAGSLDGKACIVDSVCR
jgi:hypothetical protein